MLFASIAIFVLGIFVFLYARYFNKDEYDPFWMKYFISIVVFVFSMLFLIMYLVVPHGGRSAKFEDIADGNAHIDTTYIIHNNDTTMKLGIEWNDEN